MKKRFAAFLAAALMGTMILSGCGNEKEETKAAETSAETAAETKVDETKAAETTAGEAVDKVIMVVSFGTSYNDSREATIGAIETAIADANPEYEVRRAFTSQIIIDKLKERDGLEIDNVEEALDRAVADGVKTLVVQPTHLMDGYEYTDLADALKEYEDKFEQVVLAEPLLTSDEDFDAVAKAIAEETASYDDGQTAICFMGHGTEAASNAVYETLQDQLTQSGHENYYIGTVEAEPSLDTVLSAVQKGTYERVILVPLMIVAGDHANNDMAGEEADSWKSTFEAAGYQVECLLNGLGELESIQKILVEHAQDAIDSLHS